VDINTLDDLLSALENRLDFFVSRGCGISDHGFERFPKSYAEKSEADKLFKNRDRLTDTEKDSLFGYLLLWLAKEYGKRGMLKGKTATAFPEFRKYLEGATLAENNVARDGRFITAAGMGAAFDFGLELITAMKDRETADKISSAVCAK
jgi:hypothetical protein